MTNKTPIRFSDSIAKRTPRHPTKFPENNFVLKKSETIF